ncbi:hypothetical protein BDZ90DRAFT_52237 [Jaminaea rosea]|uniref:Secreted protein n=1 Tax=Jaminaea rosea TaxID=1569628 RepID=A0A316UM10_9BASI|nr:hypothetical protein BDZ90DRAFT_52237 [Jaminaea rosea]PWN26322.1 hypothetical protein BDZ90DRAFT_52237 [Jaminaea rosea]
MAQRLTFLVFLVVAAAEVAFLGAMVISVRWGGVVVCAGGEGWMYAAWIEEREEARGARRSGYWWSAGHFSCFRRGNMLCWSSNVSHALHRGRRRDRWPVHACIHGVDASMMMTSTGADERLSQLSIHPDAVRPLLDMP